MNATPTGPGAVTRRSTLTGAALAAIGVGAAAPALAAHPDAALLATLAKFDALERQFLGLFSGPNAIEDEDERDEAIDPLRDAGRALIEDICSTRATTMEGLAARFSTILLYDLTIDVQELLDSDCNCERLMGAFYRDFMAVSGAKRALPPSYRSSAPALAARQWPVGQPYYNADDPKQPYQGPDGSAAEATS